MAPKCFIHLKVKRDFNLCFKINEGSFSRLCKFKICIRVCVCVCVCVCVWVVFKLRNQEFLSEQPVVLSC